jgi:hypothetical protein
MLVEEQPQAAPGRIASLPDPKVKWAGLKAKERFPLRFPVRRDDERRVQAAHPIGRLAGFAAV